ncbi:hypothetical protein ACQWHW_25275, partial [Salmonella enterica subsp. enterica serovar Infantis]
HMGFYLLFNTHIRRKLAADDDGRITFYLGGDFAHVVFDVALLKNYDAAPEQQSRDDWYNASG